MKRFILTFTLTLTTSLVVGAQPSGSNSVTDSQIGHVMIHPLFAVDYGCSEHWEGQLPYPGDALGSDCFVYGGSLTDQTGFLKTFKSDGSTNEDWYGWGETVLVPFDSVVAKINVNSVVNKPGQMGNGPATFVAFKQDDGTMVIIAHVTGVSVKEGDKVASGQPFAKVGNNGFSRAPHIHVGAWRNKTPLQIRFDLRALGRLRNKK